MIARGQKGFGLLEILIATGLLCVLGLALSQSIANGAKGQAAIQSQSDMVSLNHLIGLVASNGNQCVFNFSTTRNTLARVFDPTALPKTFELPNGFAYSDGTLIVPPKGSNWRGLTIQHAQLVILKPITPNSSYLATIHIEASKAGGPTLLGSSLFSQNIYIYLGVIPDAVAPNVDVISCNSFPQGRISCPAGWLLAGQAGVQGTYCITSAQAGNDTWTNAQIACGGLGGHLCMPSEFNYACTFNSLGASSWVDSFDGDGCAGGGCANTMTGCSNPNGASYTSPYPFYCCMR